MNILSLVASNVVLLVCLIGALLSYSNARGQRSSLRLREAELRKKLSSAAIVTETLSNEYADLQNERDEDKRQLDMLENRVKDMKRRVTGFKEHDIHEFKHGNRYLSGYVFDIVPYGDVYEMPEMHDGKKVVPGGKLSRIDPFQPEPIFAIEDETTVTLYRPLFFR